jgi:mono/diheme cytochrome c family protein
VTGRDVARWSILVALVFTRVALGEPTLPTAGQSAPPSFNDDIRPILSENCFACHGPDSANREAGLRLDQFASATAELDSGSRAIVPGDPAASELFARIKDADPDLVMPPPAAKLDRLSTEQVATLEKWIASGAEYQPHWAFVPPQKPGADDVSAAIDRLVAEKLADRGLALQPEADRTTLIRRATFDLTGLPPTPEEVVAFATDDSADAYDRLLDQLLARPQYGERMAVEWLDLARYSDSYGFQVDRPRPTMWPWRDWVVSAFNRNLPWDEFVTWQVAGDLLPDAAGEQILATAFNRLHQQEAEGGSVEEEYRVAYVNDRVTTFGTAFLGLTLECCRCHDHKFDPLSQADFYSLFAFFDDIDEAGLYSFFTDAVPTPNLRLEQPDQDAALARAEETCGEALAAVAAREVVVRQSVADWLAGRAERPAALAAEPRGSIPGELARYGFDARRDDGRFTNLAPDAADDAAATSPPENTLDSGRFGQAIHLTGDHPVTTTVGNFHRSQPFTVALWLKSPMAFDRAVVFHRSKAWTDAGSRGYELLVDRGHLRWSLIHFWPGDAASVRMAESLPLDEWVHVAVASDGSGRAAGLQLFVNGHRVATDVVRDSLTRDITGGGGDTITVGERMRDHGFKDGLVDDFRVFDRQLSPLEVRDLAEPGVLEATLTTATAVDLVADHVASVCDPEALALRHRLQTARRSRDEQVERAAEIMVMKELPEPKVAYVLERGEYDKRGAAVTANTPSALPPFPPGQPRNRLGLARWLVEPDHPLLARVTVNRLWQSLFEIGLVATPEDFGSQSAKPVYPEVLDLLAWKFSHPVTEGGFGWDLKRLVKSIMRSRTYRQRSLVDAMTMADDPQNAWLARGPSHRLPAEMIRDQALAASGLLVPTIGGPPVKPYDSPESFKPEPPDAGASLYRRSLYTFWRRTGPPPVLEAFDAPPRLVCVARRDTTNTPLHALVLLNGPQFIEAARVLAERLLTEHGGRGGEAAEHAFAILTSRSPDETEQTIIRDLHAGQQAWYESHPADAVALVAIGARPWAVAAPAIDVAALATTINGLMNFDEVVVKR